MGGQGAREGHQGLGTAPVSMVTHLFQHFNKQFCSTLCITWTAVCVCVCVCVCMRKRELGVPG